MSTLLLRLAAPLQSWGVDAKFDRRGTQRVPSKSAIIGLVAAALGRRRNESIEDLQSLCFGVRVDQEGVLVRDYHTARGRDPYVTQRYYLADAVFLAGLEGEENILAEIERALCYPAFPLFLGRRSCPPEGQLVLGIRRGRSILEALNLEPWLVSQQGQRRESSKVQLRIVTDADKADTGAYFQRDDPLSFDQSHRKFGFRRINESMSWVNSTQRDDSTQHDPMSELKKED